MIAFSLSCPGAGAGDRDDTAPPFRFPARAARPVRVPPAHLGRRLPVGSNGPHPDVGVFPHQEVWKGLVEFARIDVDLFIRGGRAILNAIERQGYDVWARRPEVSKWEKGKLLLGAVVRKLL